MEWKLLKHIFDYEQTLDRLFLVAHMKGILESRNTNA